MMSWVGHGNLGWVESGKIDMVHDGLCRSIEWVQCIWWVTTAFGIWCDSDGSGGLGGLDEF